MQHRTLHGRSRGQQPNPENLFLKKLIVIEQDCEIQCKVFTYFAWNFFFFSVLGFELKAYTLSHFTRPFCGGFFRDKFSLFAWASFEPRSS
jgi:hypothetical protein